MAALNVNKVFLCGRLTQEPELKTTPSGLPLCSFSLAVDRRLKEGKEADFINCVAWRQTAEFISKYFHKGNSIYLEGSIKWRQWEKDGQKHSAHDVLIDKADFVDNKGGQTAEAAPAPTDEDALPF